MNKNSISVLLTNILSKENRIVLSVFILICVVTILGLPLDLIDPDAALYATISKTIATNNDFINLYSLGHDWLDKPHFPFWITAISFKIFGVSNFAYKLPAVLVFFFGVYATYKFTKNNYNTKTAVYASIILATATHSIISNFDVRAEPYLTAFIITSIYYIDNFLKSKKLKYLVFACLFAAFAIMTKGIFALIPIITALAGELMIKRNWKQVFHPIWLLAVLLIFVFILPELYALYVQFDMHPEKLIFNKNNVSGLRFFFWDSQFGRFFNTSPIKGSGDKFFFFHTILWAFLPWGILFYIATFKKIKRNFKRVIKKEEFYTICGSLATILIFSLSKFQLAHYTNIVFPFMALLVADFIYKLESKSNEKYKAYTVIFWVQNVIAILILIYLFYIMDLSINFLFLIILLPSIVLIRKIYISQKQNIIKLFWISTLFFLNVYGFLFTHFYPTVLKYQGGVNAARFINKNYNGKGSLIDNRIKHFSFEFYQDKNFKRVDSLKLHKETGRVFYIDKNECQLLKRQQVDFEIIKEINMFSASKLKLKFLNSKTRKDALYKKYLVKIK